jgi:hypothetical protein
MFSWKPPESKKLAEVFCEPFLILKKYFARSCFHFEKSLLVHKQWGIGLKVMATVVRASGHKNSGKIIFETIAWKRTKLGRIFVTI